MINTNVIIVILILLIPLMLNWGIRIGKALQKDIPPVPLAEPVQKVTEGAKRAGKRMVKLIKDMGELKALKKVEKKYIGPFN
jgi:integrase